VLETLAQRSNSC